MTIPSNLRVPFVSVEIDNTKSQQGSVLKAYRALILAQKTSAGAQTVNTLAKVASEAQVVAAGGRGSMAHRMAKRWFQNNAATEVWLGVVADDAGGTAASGTLSFTGPATQAGTIALYIGGDRIAVGVNSGDADTVIAAAVNAAINLALDLSVTSTVSTAVVTMTHRHKGLVGNSLDVRLNYNDGESLPAGVGCTIVALASGATNPTLTTMITALGDVQFDVIAFPWSDATSLTAIETELESRWGPMRMIDGLAVTAASGTYAALAAVGAARNSKQSAIFEAHLMPTPPIEVAAAAAAVIAFYGAADPARPFQTLTLKGVLPPAESGRFTLTERNLLLFDGISVTRAIAGGSVVIDRAITTYQTNSVGADDTSYLDITSMLTLSYLRYSFRNRIQTRYPRHKLANDGTRYGAGQAIITPLLAKAEAMNWFSEMEKLGLVENADQFKTDLVVARDVSDPNRLNFLLPPDLINFLAVTAANIQFRL